MDISSKIRVENNVSILFELKRGKLYYDLEECNINILPSIISLAFLFITPSVNGSEQFIKNIKNNKTILYKKLNVYQQIDTGLMEYNNICYEKTNTTEKNLNEGNYLFIFNRTKIFVTFTGNKMTYELEDVSLNDNNIL